MLTKDLSSEDVQRSRHRRDPGHQDEPIERSIGAPPSAASARAGLPWPVTIYLLCVILPIALPVGPLAMTVLRLFLLIVTVPLLMRLLLGSYGRVLAIDVLFILHMAWATIALAVNNPDQVIQQVGSVGIEFLGGYVVGRAYIRTPEAFVALCRRFATIVICTLPLALPEAFTGRPYVIEIIGDLPAVSSVAVITYERRMGLDRAQVLFAHPIHYGLFCSIAFSLVFVGLKGFMSTVRRVATTMLVALCTFLSLSSGALLAVAVQVGFIVWAATFSSVRQRWWLLFGLFVIAYIVVDLLSNRTPLDVFMTYATFSPGTAYFRKLIFDYGIEDVWSNPVFGIGLNDWTRPKWMQVVSSVDNFWLLMAMRYGIPGFLFLAVGFGIGILRVMRIRTDGDAMLTQIRRSWVFTFLGLSFTLCTVHVWTNIYSFVIFMFGAGMWMITTAPRVSTMEDATADDSARRTSQTQRENHVPRTPTLSRGSTDKATDRRLPSRYSRFPTQIRSRRDS